MKAQDRAIRFLSEKASFKDVNVTVNEVDVVQHERSGENMPRTRISPLVPELNSDVSVTQNQSVRSMDDVSQSMSQAPSSSRAILDRPPVDFSS